MNLFGELRYQKVNVFIYAFNTGSLELHRKLGFQEEGRLRRMIYTDGGYDEFALRMTAEEFVQRQKEKRAKQLGYDLTSYET